MKCLLSILTALTFASCTERTAEVPAFTSLASVAESVPSTIKLGTPGKWNIVGIEQASDAVKTAAKRRMAVLAMKVAIFEPYDKDGFAYRLRAEDDEVSIDGTAIPVRVWAYFRKEQAEALGAVHKGSNLSVFGRMERADIGLFKRKPRLCLDLYDAELR